MISAENGARQLARLSQLPYFDLLPEECVRDIAEAMKRYCQTDEELDGAVSIVVFEWPKWLGIPAFRDLVIEERSKGQSHGTPHLTGDLKQDRRIMHELALRHEAEEYHAYFEGEKPTDICPECQSYGIVERDGRAVRCGCDAGQSLKPDIAEKLLRVAQDSLDAKKRRSQLEIVVRKPEEKPKLSREELSAEMERIRRKAKAENGQKRDGAA